MQSNFIERIYKVYVCTGDMQPNESKKYCQSILKDFQQKLDINRQKVFVIPSRNFMDEIKIYTTYFDENSKTYYVTEI